MKILITGASGGLGTQLLKALLKANDISLKVLIHKKPIPSLNQKPEEVTGSLEDRNSLISAVHGIDTVVHLAAKTHSNSSQDYFRINTQGTQNLLEVCETSEIKRFIYVSSFAAGEHGGPYARSKFLAEKLVQASDIDWVILRPSEVYGPGSPDAINQLIGLIQKSPIIPIIGDGSYILSPVAIDDIVPAMVEAIVSENLKNARIDLTGPESMTFTSLIERIESYLGLKRTKLFIPLSLAKLAVEFLILLKEDAIARDQIPRLVNPRDSISSRPKSRSGYQPKSLEQGLEKIILLGDRHV